MSDAWFQRPDVLCLQDHERAASATALEHLKASLGGQGSRADTVDAQIFTVHDPE